MSSNTLIILVLLAHLIYSLIEMSMNTKLNN